MENTKISASKAKQVSDIVTDARKKADELLDLTYDAIKKAAASGEYLLTVGGYGNSVIAEFAMSDLRDNGYETFLCPAFIRVTWNSPKD